MGHRRRIVGARRRPPRLAARAQRLRSAVRTARTAAARERARWLRRSAASSRVEQPVARGDRRLAEAADGARAGVRDRAAVVEHGHVLARPRGPRRRAGRSRRATRGGRSARRRSGRARAARGRAAPARSPASATACAGRRGAGSARAPGRAARRGRSGAEASKIRTPSARVAGGDEPLERRQPAGRVAPGELVLGGRARRRRAWLATASSSTSSIVRSTERSARLSSSRRLALLLVERGERARPGATGRRRALAALARQRDRRGDVVGLGQRQPQRLDLGQRVLAVTARRAVRAREAVAPLPAAQRVRADAEHHGSRVGPDSTHLRSYRAIGAVNASARNRRLQHGRRVQRQELACVRRVDGARRSRSVEDDQRRRGGPQLAIRALQPHAEGVRRAHDDAARLPRRRAPPR